MKFVRWVRNINPFAVIEGVLTAASVALVTATVGSSLGEHLGVTGHAGLALGWAIALVFDVLWVSSLKMAVTAIRQRSIIGMVVMLSVAIASVGASVAALFILGHAAAYAFTPVAVLVFMGLRLFSEHTLADAATARQIAKASADARNAAALARSDAATLASAATTDLILETADHLAAIRKDVVRIGMLTDADTKISKARAKAMKKLESAHEKHGAAAARYQAQLALPVSSVTETVRDDTQVTEVSDAPALPVQRDVTDEEYGVTELDVMLDGLDDVAAIEMVETLADMASVAGEDVPEPGDTLTDGQIEVVLRWIRWMKTPPLDYRPAAAIYRKEGFKGAEGRLRAAWAAIERAEQTL